jgi:hypothetical protein
LIGGQQVDWDSSPAEYPLPETILQSFPTASPLVRVYGAIIFYLENQEKVEAYLRDQDRLWAEVTTKETCLPETLSRRLRAVREHPDPRQC